MKRILFAILLTACAASPRLTEAESLQLRLDRASRDLEAAAVPDCARAALLRDDICQLSERICALAPDRCPAARARCQHARDRVASRCPIDPAGAGTPAAPAPLPDHR